MEANSQREPVTRAWAWTLVGVLWVAYFLSFCDRQVVYAIFPILKAELGFSNAQLGLTGSIFLWATAISSPLAAKLGDRYQKKWLIVWNLLAWSMATGVTGLANSPEGLLTARAFLGATEALFIPLAVSLIGGCLPPALRSRAVALFFTAQLCGVVLGSSIGAWIAENYGWRWSFAVLGLSGMFFAAPLAAFFHGFREPSQPSIGKSTRSSFRDLVRVPTFVSFCVCFPAFLMALTIFYAWLADIFHERFALSLTQAAFAATAYLQGGTALGLFAGSFLSDRWALRKAPARFWLLSVAMLFGAPCVYVVGAAQSLGLAELAAAGFGIANGIYTANLMVAPFDVVPERSRTLAIALINTIAPPLSGLATLLTGVWKDRIGVSGITTILALMTFASGLILLISTQFLFERDHKLRGAVPAAQPEFIS